MRSIRRFIKPIDRVLASIGRPFSALPTWARLCVWLAAAGVLALTLANVVTRDATFSINADTAVFAVEPACGHHLVWDLPAGAIGMPSADLIEPQQSKKIGVSLRGGAHARVQLDGTGHWLIDFNRSDRFGCGQAADVITITTDAGVRTVGDNQLWSYRSNAAIKPDSTPVLLLKGRVVIGDEILFGSSAADGVAILDRATVDVRSPDAQTGQRRQIHQEAIDPGGMIDTHACLDAPLESRLQLAECVRRARSAAEGFVRTVERDNQPVLQVQLAVTGRHIGVRQQGGSERRVLVTWWSSVVHSSLVQMFVAAMVLLSALVQLWGALKREPKQERTAPDGAGGNDETS